MWTAASEACGYLFFILYIISNNVSLSGALVTIDLYDLDHLQRFRVAILFLHKLVNGILLLLQN